MNATEEQPDPRSELDAQLQVTEWAIPSRRPATGPVEPGAPTWWHGEEEASEAFMREMGIRLGPDGAVIRTR